MVVDEQSKGVAVEVKSRGGTMGPWPRTTGLGGGVVEQRGRAVVDMSSEGRRRG